MRTVSLHQRYKYRQIRWRIIVSYLRNPRNINDQNNHQKLKIKKKTQL